LSYWFNQTIYPDLLQVRLVLTKSELLGIVRAGKLTGWVPTNNIKTLKGYRLQ